MNAITAMKASLIKTTRDDRTFARLPDETIEIEAADEDALFGLFFREYDNRYKYCNTISFAFQDEALKERYRVWFSDIGNYMRNGGDMW